MFIVNFYDCDVSSNFYNVCKNFHGHTFQININIWINMSMTIPKKIESFHQGHPLSGLLFALGPFRAYWCAMMVPFVIYNWWHFNIKKFIRNFVILLNDIHIKCTSAILHNCHMETSSLSTKHIAYATFFTLSMVLKHWLL